jgi:hypothetical protein
VLCQRYVAHIAPEQKDALREVHGHPHAQIAPEIRRELAATPARGEAAAVGAMDVSYAGTWYNTVCEDDRELRRRLG